MTKREIREIRAKTAEFDKCRAEIQKLLKLQEKHDQRLEKLRKKARLIVHFVTQHPDWRSAFDDPALAS